MWKVTYAIDYLDTNPTVEFFDDFDYASCWIQEEIHKRLMLNASTFSKCPSEQELQDLEEIEYSLVRIEEVEKVNA